MPENLSSTMKWCDCKPSTTYAITWLSDCDQAEMNIGELRRKGDSEVDEQTTQVLAEEQFIFC
jgi:hypothetical protein